MSSCKSNPKNVCCGGACVTKNSCSLLTWKDPKKSAITLGSILTFLLLIKCVNLVALFFRLSTFILLISGVAEYVGKFLTGTGFVTKFKPQPKACVGETADYYAPHVVTILKKIELQTQSLYTAVDVETTLRTGVLAFFLYKLTSAFSLWTLAFTSAVLAFTVPPVYLANKEVIDKNILKGVQLGKAKASEAYKTAEVKFGPQIEKAKSAVAPAWKLIESKLPVRTAGTTVGSDSPSAANISEPSATTSSSAPHFSSETTTSTSAAKKAPKVSNVQSASASAEEAEVDFNSLGEQLKQEAQAATANSPVYSREQLDAANPF